jgi:hypothetical protein
MSHKLKVYLMAILAIAMLKLVCGVRSYGGSGSHSAQHLIHPEPERGTP